MISIITINYNDANGLENTIRSVANQTYHDFEHIIIDGNSTDTSKSILEKYNENFSFWLSEPDSGVYNAMNKGIKAAKGSYLLFLNSGDTLVDETVLEEVSREMHEGISLYYGDLIIEHNDERKEKIYPDTLSFYYFFYQGHLPHPATFIKRDLFETISYYNEDLKIASDWEFMVCAICKHNVSFKHMNIFVSNFDTKGISSIPENRKLLLAEKDKIIHNHFPLFVEDYNQLVSHKKYEALNRFSMLKDLEKYSIAQKLNSAWLKMLKFLFAANKK